MKLYNIFLLDYKRFNSDYNMFKLKILKKFLINYLYKIYIFFKFKYELSFIVFNILLNF